MDPSERAKGARARLARPGVHGKRRDRGEHRAARAISWSRDRIVSPHSPGQEAEQRGGGPSHTHMVPSRQLGKKKIEKERKILPLYSKRMLFWIKFGLNIGNINYE